MVQVQSTHDYQVYCRRSHYKINDLKQFWFDFHHNFAVFSKKYFSRILFWCAWNQLILAIPIKTDRLFSHMTYGRDASCPSYTGVQLWPWQFSSGRWWSTIGSWLIFGHPILENCSFPFSIIYRRFTRQHWAWARRRRVIAAFDQSSSSWWVSWSVPGCSRGWGAGGRFRVIGWRQSAAARCWGNFFNLDLIWIKAWFLQKLDGQTVTLGPYSIRIFITKHWSNDSWAMPTRPGWLHTSTVFHHYFWEW